MNICRKQLQLRKQNAVTPEILTDLIQYDPNDGSFVWKKRKINYFLTAKNPRRTCSSWNGKFAGKRIFKSTGDRYLLIQILGHSFKAHRVAWALHFGSWPQDQIDHINGVKIDNRIANLRAVTAGENAKNKPQSSRNSSGATGVNFHRASGRWRAFIGVRKKSIHLGEFSTFDAAMTVRKSAEKKYGFHNNHGRRQNG